MKIQVICMLFGLLSGACLDHFFAKTPAIGKMEYRDPVRGKDGSLTMEQKVVTKAPPVPAPKGNPVTRVITITVVDTVTKRDTLRCPGGEELVCPPCPPVRVTLAMTKGKLGDRVTASTPDGMILTGLDMPVYSQQPPRGRPWRLSCLLGPVAWKGLAYGASLSRDIGPVTVGVVGIASPTPMILGEIGANF